MSTLQSNKLTRLPSSPWKRFQLRRAKRMYARIALLELEAGELLLHANQLVRENSRPPMPLFEYGNDHDEQDRWMRDGGN